MDILTEVWNFIIDNKTASIITLLSFILAVIAFFKKPKIVKEFIKETTKIIKKTKKVIFPTAEDWFDYGVKAEKQNNRKKAIKCYKKAIELKPDFAEAIKNLGYIFYSETKYDEAIIYFLKIVTCKQYEYIVYHLGRAHYFLKNYDEAMTYLDKAINYYHNIINEYQKQMINDNNEKDVIKESKYWLAGAYYYKGLLYYYHNSDFKQTLLCFQNAVKNDDNYAEVYCWIGYLYYYEIFDFDKSEKNYLKSVECGDFNAYANYHLGLLYYDDKYWFDDRVENKNINKKILEKFKKTAELKYDKEKAIQHYKKAIELKSDYVEAYERLGNVYYNDKNKAIPLLDKAIELGYNYAYNTMGLVYFTNANCNGDYDKALEYYSEYIRREQDNLDNKIYFEIGRVYFEKGLYYSNVHYDEAIVYFQKSIDRKERKCSNAYYYMGLAFINKSLVNSKDSKIGIRHIQRAAELGFSEAQDFLNDSENKKLISNAETAEVEQHIIYTLIK